MKILLKICVISTLVIFSSCASRDKEVKEIYGKSVEMDSILRANPVLAMENRMKADELIEEYMAFAEKYPEDSLSPEFMFKSAMIYHITTEFKKELETLDKLVKTFPKSELAPQALATAARVSEGDMNDIEKSKSYLIQLRDKYPESVYSVNIDMQIEYAGDAEGLLNAIMAKKGVNLDEVLDAADSTDAMKK